MWTIGCIIVTLTLIGIIVECLLQEKQQEEKWDNCQCSVCTGERTNRVI